MTVHWWLPGSVPGCPAEITQEFTAEQAEVTCPICADAIASPVYRNLVRQRAANVAYKIDHHLYPWDR